MKTLQAIFGGKMKMTVMNRTNLIAAKAAEEVAYNQETEVFCITKDNIDQYEGEF